MNFKKPTIVKYAHTVFSEDKLSYVVAWTPEGRAKAIAIEKKSNIFTEISFFDLCNKMVASTEYKQRQAARMIDEVLTSKARLKSCAIIHFNNLFK